MGIISTVAATCLAMNIYMEGRSEPIEGQWAVAQVTLRRAGSTRPDHVCPTVAARHQFSWTTGSGGQRVTALDRAAWRNAESIARQSLLWYTLRHRADYSRGATHYHTRDVNPYWAKSMVETARIGNHIFYKEK